MTLLLITVCHDEQQEEPWRWSNEFWRTTGQTTDVSREQVCLLVNTHLFYLLHTHILLTFALW